MFNLTGKRYLFLIISLIVIVPGTISLIFKGFNVGIDFAGGSSLQFRPAQHVTNTAQLRDLLNGLGFKDVQINIGSDKSTPADHIAWVRLNTEIDKNVQNTIQTDIQNKYGPDTSVTADPLQVTVNGKATTVTVITLASKSTPFKVSDLQTLLNKLPNTTNTAQSTSSSSTVSPALTPTATTTPQAGTTPTPGSTPAATNPAANIPVHADAIQVGLTTDTINILTTTTTASTNTNGPTPVRQIQAAFLNQAHNYLYTLSNSSVSSSVASAAITNSILAVFAASALILLYIWFAFRKVQKPWRYGACAILALLHDVLVVMGVFSILGWTLKIQINALFITALLTVVGFSVHDTIVVFDRIRENLQRRTSETFEQIVNASLVQTMSRSLNTSLTVLLTLSALTLFGGESVRTFTFALLIGIFSGTYSSIFNASMLLVIWERGELGLWRFNRDQRTPDGRRRVISEHELARTRG